MLPNLSQLALCSDSVGAPNEHTLGKKRSRLGSMNSDVQSDAWRADSKDWMARVAETWNGRREWSVLWECLSPDGNWMHRQYEARAVLTPGLLRDRCTVLRNVHNFEPNGCHYMDINCVSEGLHKHYTDQPDALDFAEKTMPKPSATTQDIREWVANLEPPLWTRDFGLWDRHIRDRTFRLTSAMNDNRLEWEGASYLGETSVVRISGRRVPNGDGILKFEDGSSWRGRWRYGKRTNDLGTHTASNSVVTIGRWPSETSLIRSTSQIAFDELKTWNENNPGPVWADMVLVEKLGYGSIAVGVGRQSVVLRQSNWHTEQAITNMMLSTNPFELGIGRDTTAYMPNGMAYTQLHPIAVFDVDYTNSYVLRDWFAYQAKLKSDLSQDDGDHVQSGYSYVTRIDKACPANGRQINGAFVDTNLASFGVPLEEDIHEKFLIHATKPDNLFAILNNSFDISFGSRGLFGAGVYFAEDPGKNDQYATPEPSTSDLCKRLGLDSPAVKRVLKEHAVTSKEEEGIRDESLLDDDDYFEEYGKDVFFLLVSRLALGKVAETAIHDFKLNKIPVADSRRGSEDEDVLFIDGEIDDMSRVKELDPEYNSVTVPPNPLRYREFMIYKNGVARVSHVVAYCRAREREVLRVRDSSGNIRQDFDDDYIRDILAEDKTSNPNDNMRYKDPFAA